MYTTTFVKQRSSPRSRYNKYNETNKNIEYSFTTHESTFQRKQLLLVYFQCILFFLNQEIYLKVCMYSPGVKGGGRNVGG